MDETYKLRIKIGEHEFDSEGPIDVVQNQFAVFQQMIATLPKKQEKESEAAPHEAKSKTPLPHLPLNKIMKVEGRVVSLTAKCESVDEAVLLILLGQKEFRGNQEVTGSEIMDGLKDSGYKVGRVDRTMDKLSSEGSVITMGIHRGRRYRVTNPGLKKALSIAQEIIATVP